VKVGNKPIDGAEFVRRPDEDASVPGLFAKGSVLIDRALECADARRADCPDLAAGAPSCVEDIRGTLGQTERLLVHHVIGGMLGVDRLEGSCADVEHDIRTLYSFSREAIE